uniref:glutathione transferase n=1 Tax=Hucho hucho TaxID=62062 RepID=A0A4W5QUS4_9TELE
MMPCRHVNLQLNSHVGHMTQCFTEVHFFFRTVSRLCKLTYSEFTHVKSAYLSLDILVKYNFTMSGKVVLTYFNGRGRMESIRWLLAVAGVEFEEVNITKRQEYVKLLSDGALMFEQVPLVEMDGMKLVQTKAILNYIAGKYSLYGKDLKERVMIDMYAEGVQDLMQLMMALPFMPPDANKTKLEEIERKATSRYLPVFEKALFSSQYLVGNQLSCADVQLLETTLMLEEKFPTILSKFPVVKAFQGRMKSLPAIHKFLQPGSKRKPQSDDIYVKTVCEVLDFKP